MLSLLDCYLPAELSDLIASFIPGKYLHVVSNFSRVFTGRNDSKGMPVPREVFRTAVLAHWSRYGCLEFFPRQKGTCRETMFHNGVWSTKVRKFAFTKDGFEYIA